jgi:ATP-dependent RNA helicase DDX18/HAS1
VLTSCCMRAQAAREAYRSFLLAYNSHQLKSIFNVHRLDLVAVAKSFGFSAPPKVCSAGFNV